MGIEDIWFGIRPLCIVLHRILIFFHSILDHWGLSIISLSILMRLFTFPISKYGAKQQKIYQEKQTKIKPLLDEINIEYKDDSARCYRETVKLYKEHNYSHLSPFKGCLWILVQLPIFIALFQILSHAQEIRGQSFLWIQDLSEPERLFNFGITIPILGNWFNLLPIVMCIVQAFQARLIAITNSEKKKNRGNFGVYFLPISMMILFYQFASGLLLYWTTTNICQITEQLIFNKRMEEKKV